jgi:hypothetical protein
MDIRPEIDTPRTRGSSHAQSCEREGKLFYEFIPRGTASAFQSANILLSFPQSTRHSPWPAMLREVKRPLLIRAWTG